MHIRTATIEDVSDIASVIADAMAEDECVGLRSFLCPYGYRCPLSRRHGFLRRCKNRFYHGDEIYVMVSDQQDIDWTGTERTMGSIAMSKFAPDQHFDLMAWLNQRLYKLEETFRWYFHLDQSTSHERLEAYFASEAHIDLASFIQPKGANHYYCENLAVAPAYQRRGIAQALIEHVQHVARLQVLPIILRSSEAGEALYLRYGFAEVAKVLFADGSGIIDPVLLWQPKESCSKEAG